jgi:hypothetical protein
MWTNDGPADSGDTEVMHMKRQAGRALFAAVAAAVAVLAPASSASAGLISQSATVCPTYATSKIFSRWLDPFSYALAPGGDFESATRLTFSGGAKIVSGNETSYVHGASDRSSVLLPRGATVTTAPMCIGLINPTLRFFARRPGFALLPLMTVEGVYKDKAGNTRSLPLIGVPLAGGNWSLQLPFVVTGALLELGDTTMMQFRFRALSGDWQIDDVYVDPMRNR